MTNKQMDLQQACDYLAETTLKSKIIYLHTEPEILDFTTDTSGKVIVRTAGSTQRVELPISKDIPTLRTLAGILQVTIFREDVTLLSWHIKSLLSYLRFFLNKSPALNCSIVELSSIEHYLNIDKPIPKSMIEAMNRFKAVMQKPVWKTVYKQIHLPLHTKVLPTLETTPILDKEARHRRYAFYEVEGQVNGRLKSSRKYLRYYNPHTMTPEQKANFILTEQDEFFMYADYRNCEVAVLQHLSGDQNLKSIMESGKDVYASIYKVITGEDIEEAEAHSKCKLAFLPVMYGCGPKGLAENLKVSESVANKIIARIKSGFADAYKWVSQSQFDSQEKGFATDYFGRPRTFDDHYKARNFVIQSPAGTVCLEKLIGLYNLDKKHYNLLMSIHDGYVMSCRKEFAAKAYKEVKSVLESDFKLCPGLRMKVDIKFGYRLNKMKTL